MRGTLFRHPYPELLLRFIPACAGNTTRSSRLPVCLPVHPRVCGEHSFAASIFSFVPGSSPRVRGTLSTLHPHHIGLRFIPACAGNTWIALDSRPRSAVHPRVCGEHYPRGERQVVAIGSSPRVRGTRRSRQGVHTMSRFIPACAGNTPAARSRSRPASVHPRVCGEHDKRAFMRFTQSGSSPRVRGTRRWRTTGRWPCRFIPACAGNTQRPYQIFQSRSVHPRVCGEHIKPTRATARYLGSSPRVRGTLFPQEFDTKHFSRCQRAHQRFTVHSTRWQRCKPAGQLAHASVWVVSDERGMKLTSLKPSRSVGSRRLVPHVSKS